MNPCVLDTHGAMVALAILSPVFFLVRTTHRRQGGALWAQRYHPAAHTEYLRIHASGAGFPELFISMSRTPLRSSFSTSPVIELSWL